MKKEVVIIGSSGHAKVIIDIFEKSGSHDIVGLLDAYRKPGEETLSYPVLGDENILPQLISEHPGLELFIAIGDNWIRKQVVQKINSIIPSSLYAIAIHPSAQIAKSVSIATGTAIMAGTAINSASAIGAFSILNTHSSLDHDCTMGDFSSIAPGVTTGGNVHIGSFSAVGIGATLKHGISIGQNTIIGAGSIVMKNCSDDAVFYGSPAKFIRSRNLGDKYL